MRRQMMFINTPLAASSFKLNNLCASNKNYKPMQSDYFTSCNPRGWHSNIFCTPIFVLGLSRKIGRARPIFAENFAKIGPSPATFAAKGGAVGPILAAKSAPSLPILAPPVKYKLKQLVIAS